MLNLDTHILLHALQGSVTRHERSLLSRHRWGISAIALWEIAKLHQRGRITLSLEDPALIRALDEIEIWPITREVCLNLRRLDFHSDPADELIAATSLTHGAALLTRDERIRASKVVRLA